MEVRPWETEDVSRHPERAPDDEQTAGSDADELARRSGTSSHFRESNGVRAEAVELHWIHRRATR